jgi:hypothetical protein
VNIGEAQVPGTVARVVAVGSGAQAAIAACRWRTQAPAAPFQLTTLPPLSSRWQSVIMAMPTPVAFTADKPFRVGVDWLAAPAFLLRESLSKTPQRRQLLAGGESNGVPEIGQPHENACIEKFHQLRGRSKRSVPDFAFRLPSFGQDWRPSPTCLSLCPTPCFAEVPEVLESSTSPISTNGESRSQSSEISLELWHS